MPGGELRDLPHQRFPGKVEQEGVWAIINEAMQEAPAVVRKGGRDPKDWWYVLVAALNIVIKTRDRDAGLAKSHPDNPALKVTSPQQLALAYADHYLQMRADAFYLGPDHRQQLFDAVVSYDLTKVRGLTMRTGPGEVSPATDVSLSWGWQGVLDGLQDRNSHEVTTDVVKVASGWYDRLMFAGQDAALDLHWLYHQIASVF